MSAQTGNDTNREQVEMGKLFAEMMNLIEDTRKKEEEREMLRVEMRRSEDERERIRDEQEKLRAEARKMWTEARWYPIWVAAALLAAGAALAKLFLS